VEMSHPKTLIIQKLLPARDDLSSSRRADTGPSSRHSSSVNRIVHFASGWISLHSGIEGEVAGVMMWKGSHGCSSSRPPSVPTALAAAEEERGTGGGR
jgi:hypothetical protein